jgi:hypothetical protein
LAEVALPEVALDVLVMSWMPVGSMPGPVKRTRKYTGKRCFLPVFDAFEGGLTRAAAECPAQTPLSAMRCRPDSRFDSP